MKLFRWALLAAHSLKKNVANLKIIIVGAKMVGGGQ